MSPAAQASARKPDKRGAILDAALSLFVERGFHGTAVPALADRAGVGAGTIYRYFHNKEGLVNELYREWKSALVARATAKIRPGMAPREVFRAFWREMIGFVKDHPDAFAFLEMHHHASYLDEKSKVLERNALALAEQVFGVMQSQKAVRPLPANLLMSVVYGALIGTVRGAWEGLYDLDETHVAEAEACAWAAIANG